jgi:ABC-type multidrug transport system ATPase subunit
MALESRWTLPGMRGNFMSGVNGNVAISVEGLTKRVGEFVAVDNLTFQVPRGSIFGFLGPNGAGKTTTIGMLLGLIPPDGGTARVLGVDTRTQLDEALKRTGALVERPAFYPYLSGRRNLQLFARQLGITNSNCVPVALRSSYPRSSLSRSWRSSWPSSAC